MQRKLKENNMNKIYLIGNTTKDAEKSETPSGVAVCKFSIAVNRDYANADGTKITDFFNITAWRGLAETCGKYLTKGSKVAIVGSLQNRSYEDKDGIKRTVTDIVASEVEFLSTKKEAEEVKEQPRKLQLEEVDNPEDLPF
jgi:single-strand DNA-binding protein